MFQTTLNTPSIYSEKSRDFQLLSTIIDVYLNSVRSNASKMRYQISPTMCDERLLSLLCTRFGFFTSEYLPSAVVRNILSLFFEIRRNKGTRVGIQLAAHAALSTYPLLSTITTSISNTNYEVTIDCVCQDWFDIDERYIREVMKYTLPTGYLLKLVQKVNDDSKIIYITL